MSLNYTPVSNSARLAALVVAAVFSTTTLGAVVLGMTEMAGTDASLARSAPVTASFA